MTKGGVQMSNKFKERLTSKVVWLSVVAQFTLLVAMYNQNWGSEVKIILTSIIEILTLFGVLNNPTDKENF